MTPAAGETTIAEPAATVTSSADRADRRSHGCDM
jgi:hypothetical protein